MGWIQVEGESMRPFLYPGDAVDVEWSSQKVDSELRPGSIVLGRDIHGTWIVHRVVARNSSGLRVKGDAALAWDDFSSGQIWGKVVGIRRFAEGDVTPLRVNWLDRCIARVSRWSLPSDSWVAPVARRLVFLMGYFRRRIL